jgi:hypothetical protein
LVHLLQLPSAEHRYVSYGRLAAGMFIARRQDAIALTRFRILWVRRVSCNIAIDEWYQSPVNVACWSSLCVLLYVCVTGLHYSSHYRQATYLRPCSAPPTRKQTREPSRMSLSPRNRLRYDAAFLPIAVALAQGVCIMLGLWYVARYQSAVMDARMNVRSCRIAPCS